MESFSDGSGEIGRVMMSISHWILFLPNLYAIYCLVEVASLTSMLVTALEIALSCDEHGWRLSLISTLTILQST